ncbi:MULTISPECIES: gas vesicle structural protein GvpA [Streptomyces]|uniref:Gas vesicle protein A n=1 Tax=Streptomyces anthocyanicus TaxID=68174 RepID=A0ABZ1LWJ7_9ACTN|nr:gas vesicle structural protein GvpA [Streptomyces sp. ME02-6979A]MDX3344481.1 gas vesicle structural protein GvpA [Streptomyces sp. ME02-6979A]
MITYDDEVVCAPRAGTLYDVLELILDRGMVIDVFVRVSLVGIEILKVDARIVVASVDTYLRFAEACNRLDLEHDVRSKTVPEMFGSPMAKTVGRAGVRRTARSLTDKVRDVLTPEHEHEEEPEEAEDRPRAGAERGRSTQRPRSRPAARPRDEDDRPRSRPRRRTEEEDR